MKSKSLWRQYLHYSTLNVMGMAGLSCYILADTFFISRGLGSAGLTALNLAIPIYSLIHGTGMMLGMGGAIKYAVYKSQRKPESHFVFTNTILLAAVFAALFLSAGIFLSPAITGLLGADNTVFSMTNTYLRTLFFFSPAFLLNDILLAFVRNDGNPQLSMYAMLGGSLSNILLDYIFIFPLKMGMFGAVFATGLAPLISILLLAPHRLKRKNGFHLCTKSLHFASLFSTLPLGFPSFVTEISSGVVILVFNAILLKLSGNVGVAAYGVIANLSLVVIAVFTGIAQGTQPLLSQAYGQMDRQKTHRLLGYALLETLFLSVLIYLGIFLFAPSVTRVFNSENNPALQIIAENGLKLYFTGAAFAGCNIILCIFFSAMEKAVPAQLISLCRGLLIIVPLAFLLSFFFGITGVWLAFPATEALVTLLCIFLYKKAGSSNTTPQSLT